VLRFAFRALYAALSLRFGPSFHLHRVNRASAVSYRWWSGYTERFTVLVCNSSRTDYTTLPRVHHLSPSSSSIIGVNSDGLFVKNVFPPNGSGRFPAEVTTLCRAHHCSIPRTHNIMVNSVCTSSRGAPPGGRYYVHRVKMWNRSSLFNALGYSKAVRRLNCVSLIIVLFVFVSLKIL